MGDKSIEEKQEYIRENILEKGIEVNEFADFLASKRGEEASDISAWSMVDLGNAVREFLQNHENDKKLKAEKEKEEEDEENGDGEEEIKTKEEQNKNSNKEENKKTEDIINEKEEENDKTNNKENKPKSRKNSKKEAKNKEQIEPEPEIPKEEVNTLPPEIYGIIAPNKYECHPVENTPLSSVKDLIVKISSPEKIEGGFFSKSYITYLVSTTEPSLSVKRRYSDFEWLHQMLLNLYPYLLIPPIPKKNTIVSDKFNLGFVCKRMRFLRKFIDWLVANPVIRNSKLFYDFLSVQKDEDFAKVKLEYQKMNQPINLIEFYAVNGKMNLSINKEKETFFKNIYDSTINNEIVFSNLNTSIKELKTQFDILIEKMEEVHKNWEAIYLNSKKYYENINI